MSEQSDRERKIAFVWFCLGYAHGYDTGDQHLSYEPRQRWDELTEYKKDGWIKEIQDIQGGDDGNKSV